MKLANSIQTRYLLMIFFIISGCTLPANANTDKNTPVALQGYDPVAYFTIQQAKKGSPQHSYSWKGQTWHFSSSQHLEKFKASPDKYLPQFNGLCANGLSDGHAIEADPKNWRVIDGKLYLFFSQFGRNQWSGDVKELINSASDTFKEN